MSDGLAFIFPGQGSQRIGMLAEAAEVFPEVGSTFREASDALGFDLWDLVQNGDPETLTLTENTQPALLAASVALWRAWEAAGGSRPSAMAGHSLGEFSALCCAGSLDFADAVCLVRDRGRFMQSAVPKGVGAMAAVIGLDDDAILEICAGLSDKDAVVSAVNFNSPGQVVIAGHAATVAQASEQLSAAGARKVMPLPVSAPFHTSLMEPAGVQLAEVLDGITIREPEIPVYHNVTMAPAGDPQQIRELLVTQISAPVPWTGCIDALHAAGCQRFVECGPGKVLGGLLRRIDKSLECAFTEEPDGLRSAAASWA